MNKGPSEYFFKYFQQWALNSDSAPVVISCSGGRGSPVPWSQGQAPAPFPWPGRAQVLQPGQPEVSVQSSEGSVLPPLHTWKSALRRKGVVDFLFLWGKSRAFSKRGDLAGGVRNVAILLGLLIYPFLVFNPVICNESLMCSEESCNLHK